MLFPGFLAIILAAIGVVNVMRRSASLDASAPEVATARETVLLYGSLGALAFWASLGPRAGLYSLLFKTIPVFSLLRAPGRTGIIVVTDPGAFRGVRCPCPEAPDIDTDRRRLLRRGAAGNERHSDRLA